MKPTFLHLALIDLGFKQGSDLTQYYRTFHSPIGNAPSIAVRCVVGGLERTFRAAFTIDGEDEMPLCEHCLASLVGRISYWSRLTGREDTRRALRAVLEVDQAKVGG